MALDLGTIVTAVEVVQKAIEMCKRVEDLPDQMKALGRRMELQKTVLLQVESFVKEYSKGVDPILEAGQQQDLMRIIGNVKENADKVYELFEREKENILSREYNLQFKFKLPARIWFALVENQPEKIKGVMEDINHDREELSHYLQIIEKDRDKSPGPSKQNQQPPLPPPSASKALELVVPVQNNAKKRRPSPSPSPLPLRQDYKILFVDPRNQARSIVAQSLLLLLGGLTEATSNSSVPWRIAKVHSAGFFVSHKSTLTSVISGLSYSHKSYKMGPFPGNELPNPIALASVFDNKCYPYPFKSTIQTQMTKHHSVGLTEKAFKNYDYIIVFTNREHDNMVRLKDALIQSGKVSAREKGGKGRVLHLGTYIPQRNGKPKEILNVPSKLDEATGKQTESRGDWNKKAGEIKTALKVFLKDEMGWVMPCNTNGHAAQGGKKEGESENGKE
ncbi:hypothetical protein V8F33_004835 [Rhypophila sp. PSN 637]